jgi:hypothetical protein
MSAQLEIETKRYTVLSMAVLALFASVLLNNAENFSGK